MVKIDIIFTDDKLTLSFLEATNMDIAIEPAVLLPEVYPKEIIMDGKNLPQRCFLQLWWAHYLDSRVWFDQLAIL